MKICYTFFVIALYLILSSNISAQQDVGTQFFIKPPGYENTPGTATFTGPLANNDRTYQLLIHDSILTDIVGKEIQAISWRLPTGASANWPAAETTYPNFDIYMGESVAPENRSLVLADNRVGPQKLVRASNLVIPAGVYTFGNTPNDWGPEILLDSLYLYNGGHLLIEIRHTSSGGASRSVDAIGTSITGYGTAFSAAWQSSYIPTTGLQGNFSVIRLTADDVVPVELTSFKAVSSRSDVILQWTTATELNNLGFEIQRKSQNSEYEAVGFLSGAGTTTESRTYFFTDSKLANGVYYYRLKQMDYDGAFTFSDEIVIEVDAPTEFALDQNYPNPFNPSTNINFSLADAAVVKMAVYNLLGQQVAVILDEFREAGLHSVTFNASDLPSGTYFYTIETPQFKQTKKMLLTK